MEHNPCPYCDGKGFATPAKDLLARPPKEQAAYEREVAETKIRCFKCGGTGQRVSQDPHK